MGIFFTSPRPSLPTITTALEDALRVDPQALTDFKKEAAERTSQIVQSTTPTFQAWRFVGAVVIAVGLVLVAIWTKQHDLDDISKGLMDSFSGFSGVVVGLLGGEAQKS